MGLFRKGKKGPGEQVLRLVDADGKEVIRSSIDLFPFQEAVIIAASEEFFRDPDPCEIHRRVLQLRLSAELREAIPPGTKVNRKELPKEIAGYFQGYDFEYALCDAEE